MPKETKEDPIAFRGWAIMLGNAGHILATMHDLFSTAPKSSPGRGGFVFSCGFGCTILYALSVELDLKCLAYCRTGTHKHTHDLLELYQDLEDDVRSIVNEVDSRTAARDQSRPLLDILKSNRKTFVEFRYPEIGKSYPPWPEMRRVHNVLMEAIDEPAFRALCTKVLNALEKKRWPSGSV